MIIFIYGTTAEAIKIAPVARRLAALGVPYESWVTQQHTDSLRTIIPELGLQPPTRVIADGNGGKPLQSRWDVVRWLGAVTRWSVKNLRRIRKELPPNSIVLVHGDTLTTVIGVLIAKRLRVPSAHIEAGLRSGNWRHPFPEELDRRLAGKLATIHYAPSDEAAANLTGKANVVNTIANTVVDAVLDQGLDAVDDGTPYGVVLLHRYEFMGNRPLVEATFAALAQSSPVRLKLLLDAYSGHELKDLLERHASGPFEPQGKLRHPEFIGLLKGASFVVTDSGGIQAEAALLGTPTLIHRMAVEQSEGLGENIILSHWKIESLVEFLSNHEQYRRPLRRDTKSPSQIIVDDLISRGYIQLGA